MVVMEELAHRLREVNNNQDLEATVQMYAEDAQMWFPGLKEPIKGRQSIREVYSSYWSAFPDMTYNYSQILASGEHLVVEAVSKATFRNALMTPEGEIPATGKSAEVPWMGFIKVNPDGLISEFREYYDTNNLWIQLGVKV